MPVYKISYMVNYSALGVCTTIAAETPKQAKDKIRKKVKNITAISASLAEPSTRRVNKKRTSDKKSGLRRKEFLITDEEFIYLKLRLSDYRDIKERGVNV